MKAQKPAFIRAGLLIGTASFLLCCCTDRKPILVGFSAELTGKQAELGVQERNGVQMAVERLNNSGGVNGRKIELIVVDDLGTPEGARAADGELVKKGVVAIIGHATSGQTIAGLSVTNPAQVVMLSPTTSTPELTGKDDYFLRVIQTLSERARGLAQQAYRQRGVRRLAVIYDTHNAAYVQSFRKTFIDMYLSLGGKISDEAGFSPAARTDYDAMLTRLRAGKADGLLIIASDNDTAIIAQRARLIGWNAPLYATAWAQTETLIENGGRAIEGMELEQTYALNSQAPAFLDFKAALSAAVRPRPLLRRLAWLRGASCPGGGAAKVRRQGRWIAAGVAGDQELSGAGRRLLHRQIWRRRQALLSGHHTRRRLRGLRALCA